MTTRITVDSGKCVGAGLCMVAPDYFDLGSEGTVVLLREGEVPEEDLDAVTDAATMCPAEVIRIRTSSDQS